MSRIITKIKKFGICLTAVITGIAGLVSFSSCSVILRKKDPDYHEIIYKNFNVLIPKEWENVYYNAGSLGGWHGDGTAYYVFAVSEYDEEFFNEFFDVKDEEFEEQINSFIKFSFPEEADGRLDYHGPIDPQYLFDFDQPYKWSVVKTDYDTLRIIYQSQRLYAFAFYL